MSALSAGRDLLQPQLCEQVLVFELLARGAASRRVVDHHRPRTGRVHRRDRTIEDDPAKIQAGEHVDQPAQLLRAGQRASLVQVREQLTAAAQLVLVHVAPVEFVRQQDAPGRWSGSHSAAQSEGLVVAQPTRGPNRRSGSRLSAGAATSTTTDLVTAWAHVAHFSPLAVRSAIMDLLPRSITSRPASSGCWCCGSAPWPGRPGTTRMGWPRGIHRTGTGPASHVHDAPELIVRWGMAIGSLDSASLVRGCCSTWSFVEKEIVQFGTHPCRGSRDAFPQGSSVTQRARGSKTS